MFFFFKDTPPAEISPLPLHDALPISGLQFQNMPAASPASSGESDRYADAPPASASEPITNTPDRKSTRLNSSHANISYAVFCLKKKKVSPVSGRTRAQIFRPIGTAHF